MASGFTTTSALADSLDDIRASARLVNESKGVIASTADKRVLGKGTGTTWQEVSYAHLVATAVTETTQNDNFQQISDALIGVTPTKVQITVLITDIVRNQMIREGVKLIGELAMNAVVRKREEDGVVVLDGATTTLGTTATTLASSSLTGCRSRAVGNTSEAAPVDAVFYFIGHPYHIKDLADEITAGVGTYPVPSGLSAEVFRNGLKGEIGGILIKESMHITPNSTPDAIGGVYPGGKGGALLLIEDAEIKTELERLPRTGGGSDAITVTAMYGYGERSPGNWLYRTIGDATDPS